MRHMDLVWQDKRVVRRVLAATAVTAIAHVLVMSALNERIRRNGPMLPFLIGALVFLVSSRFTGHKGALIVKKLIFDMRVRIAEKIRRAELAGIETIGVAEIRDQLTEKLEIISFGTVELVWLPQFASMAIMNAVYLASISPSAALVTSLVHGAGLLAMYLHSSTLQAEMKASAGERRRFAAAFGDLLGGFKEIKLRRRRGEAIVREIETLAEDLETSSVRAHVSRNDDGVYALSTRYALLGMAAFALPTYFSLDANATQDFVVGLLFLWTPALAVIQIYPAFIRANLAAESLHELERKLDDATYVLPRGKDSIDPWGGRWSTLETRDVEMVYQGESYESFRLGPLNLSIAAGQIVFVVGNNGAGKSTLLKLLAGLYHPSAGTIVVDGVELGAANIQAYREMIAAVLANSHLFSELYGLKDVQDEVVRAMLRKMEIEHDVAFEGGRFSRLNLSTGQRKRVALLVALLEDRPVMVFDEWAADQDPEFRKRFYEEVLPDLKRRGKTVLVATHDDRYFHLADKLITLHGGRLRETAQPTLHAEPSTMTALDMP